MTANTATVSWKEYTGLDPNEFEKYEVEIKDVVRNETKKQSTSLSKYIITNLEKNTKYDVCISIVSKSFGKSKCSNKAVIRTAVESENDKTELEKFLESQFVSKICSNYVFPILKMAKFFDQSCMECSTYHLPIYSFISGCFQKQHGS